MQPKKDILLKWLIIIIIFACIILFFISIALRSEFSYDFLATILIAILLYTLRIKLNQNRYTIIFGLAALMLHNMGVFGIYGLSLGPFRFEHIMHLIGGLAGFVMSYHFVYRLTPGKRVFAAILIAIGGGAIIEIIEYLGYGVLGAGEGLFFYGVGDYGDWANTSIDMINNLFGASIGAIIYALRSRKSRRLKTDD